MYNPYIFKTMLDVNVDKDLWFLRLHFVVDLQKLVDYKNTLT